MRGGGLSNTASCTAPAGSGRPPIIFYGTHAGAALKRKMHYLSQVGALIADGLHRENSFTSSGLVSNGQDRVDDRLGRSRSS
jgi:hypothetical protein